MHKLTISSFLFYILLVNTLYGAFEERSGYFFHPSTSVYGFHPMAMLSTSNFMVSTTASQLYSMSECNLANGNILVSLPFVHIGSNVSYFGSDFYNENELGISIFAGTRHLFGTSFKIMRVEMKNYGSHLFGGNDLFFIVHSMPFYSQSVYRNLVTYGYQLNEEKPTTEFSSLLKFYPAPWLSLNSRIVYSDLTGTNFEVGNGFQIAELLSIGGGFNFNTRSISSLLTVTLAFSDLTYQISLHPELGITHTVGLVYSSTKKIPIPSDSL